MSAALELNNICSAMLADSIHVLHFFILWGMCIKNHSEDSHVPWSERDAKISDSGNDLLIGSLHVDLMSTHMQSFSKDR